MAFGDGVGCSSESMQVSDVRGGPLSIRHPERNILLLMIMLECEKSDISLSYPVSAAAVAAATTTAAAVASTTASIAVAAPIAPACERN